MRARAALAILLAFVVHSTTAGHPPLFDSWLRVVIAAPGEMLLGVAMGMTFRLAIASVEIASEAFGPMIGFGLASLFDPKTQSQESALALLWTVGIFALNCGPVVMGLVLDYLGPKLTALIGGQRWRQAPARSTRRGEPALPPPPATTHTHHHPTPPPHTQAWC